MNTLKLIKEKFNLLTHDPICDIEETKTHTILSFDLPNMSHEDFDISIEGKTLFISVKRHHSCPKMIPTTKVVACHHQNFSREFTFPVLLNAQKIDAFYDHRVLRIAIPKNSLVVKQTVFVSDSPCGVFNPGTEKDIPLIEAFSDIDDYDWE